MKHLLVTNDFPPKVGGIQSYLWELWRRLPPEDVIVVCADHPEARAWDAAQPFQVERWPASVLLPTPALVRRIHRLAAQHGAELVVLDPVVPLGAAALQLELPYGVVVHGAELVVPANVAGYQLVVRKVLRGASLVVAAGGYPARAARAAAGRPVPHVVVPPGVDVERFHPLDDDARRRVRQRLGVDPDALVVLGVSRLVPRKGFDVAIQAVARLAEHHDGLELVLAGEGRDRARLEGIAQAMGAPVRFLGRVPDDDLPDLYGSADVFAMLCRDRWGGLEREGFGIVFLEAAACGIPQVAGRSGGSDEAVVDGETGAVIDHPRSVDDVVDALDALLEDPSRRRRQGEAARRRAEGSFTYDGLARTLATALDGVDLLGAAAGDEVPASHRGATDEGAGTGAGARPGDDDGTGGGGEGGR